MTRVSSVLNDKPWELLGANSRGIKLTLRVLFMITSMSTSTIITSKYCQAPKLQTVNSIQLNTQ